MREGDEEEPEVEIWEEEEKEREIGNREGD